MESVKEKRVKAAPVSQLAKRLRTYRKRGSAQEAGPATGWYMRHGKRLLDVSLSLVLVAAFCFLVPVLFLLIKISSRGPFLFVQERVGYQGRVFRCYKFRTMFVNDAADILQAVHNDHRITPVGKVLRRLHLDELPQLLNVLKGDMSLIGPRPHMISDDLLFMGLVPEYEVRQQVLPGLTGLAQVKGYRGPTPDFQSVSSRIKLDAFYARNASLRLDVQIIVATAFIHFSRR